MERNPDTYLNLFPIDIHGIGDVPILAGNDIEDAISTWCYRATVCLDSSSLSTKEWEFYVNFIEKYIKNTPMSDSLCIDLFKIKYVQALLDIIEKDDNYNIYKQSDIKSEYDTIPCYKMKNHALNRAEAIQELITILSCEPNFNTKRIKIKFDYISSTKDDVMSSFDAKNNVLTINKRKFDNMAYMIKDEKEIIPAAMDIIYKALTIVEKQNRIIEMNNEITLSALHYNIEKNYSRAFSSKAYSQVISTSMIDHDSREGAIYFLVNFFKSAETTQYTTINNYLIDRMQDLHDEHHYNFTMENAYSANTLTRYELITQELVTRSLISLRANPKSLPTQIKRFLFIDGELKTVYQLKKEIESLNNAKCAMNPIAYQYKLKNYTDILNYIVEYCIPLKIENMVYESRHLPTTNLNELKEKLLEFKKLYPAEYQTTIAILSNRLDKLNSYCASSAKASSYLDEILTTGKILKTLESIEDVEPEKIPGLSSISVDTKGMKVSPKVIHQLQKLTGKGVAQLVSSIMDSEELLLASNLPAELATIYTKSKELKPYVTIK